AYLAWTITLATGAERAKIEEVFEFVSDDCDISIDKLEQKNQFEAEDNAFSELMSQGVAALHDPAADISGAPTPGATPDTAVSDERREIQIAAASDIAVKQTIRVDLDKVDRLVNLVGELVITQAMLCQGVNDAALKQDTLVANGLSELEHLTRELQ